MPWTARLRVTLVISTRQVARSSPKQLTLCTVGTKKPKNATRILPMCRRNLNSQVAGGLQEGGPFKS